MIIRSRYFQPIIAIAAFLHLDAIQALIDNPTASCDHPSNYSDFTVLLVNNTIIATGGNAHRMEVWQRDVSNGLDIHHNCWTNLLDGGIDHETANITTAYQPYKHGIGFKVSDDSFAVQAGDNASTVMSRLAYFDLATYAWSSPITQGSEPSPRARMSVSLNETTNTAWFYGGRTESTEQSSDYFNSFYFFDIQTSTWNWPDTYYSGGHRPARYGHSSNLISERLFIVGGKTAVHSADANSWTLASGGFQSILIYDTANHQAISMATMGDIPPARYSFSTVNGLDGKSIVLFGGQNATDTQTFDATNDIYVLDTCTLNWSQPVISGTPPTARAGHEAIVYGDQYMIVMMGIQSYDSTAGPIYTDDTAILDMKTWTWVSSIPPTSSIGVPTATTTTAPTCRFTFPVVIPNTDGDDGDYNNNSNATVVSNTNKSPTTTQLAVGITFGILGFLLLMTGAVIFIMRIRRDVDAKQNPRWVPSVFKKRNRERLASASITSSTASA
ncbi:carnitine O-acetyltransferase yat1 [Mucor velutinosus]|uniref:Carnitine O-acetyltransferase yat1 n=1 Tax=Mucor velutinosus TaxID=708070 RepID=A0AAN7HQF8_9FUNG|nr:carnitine O-acetyltransferase yat1 [Mucor velutinosus]